MELIWGVLLTRNGTIQSITEIIHNLNGAKLDDRTGMSFPFVQTLPLS